MKNAYTEALRCHAPMLHAQLKIGLEQIKGHLPFFWSSLDISSQLRTVKDSLASVVHDIEIPEKAKELGLRYCYSHSAYIEPAAIDVLERSSSIKDGSQLQTYGNSSLETFLEVGLLQSGNLQLTSTVSHHVSLRLDAGNRIVRISPRSIFEPTYHDARAFMSELRKRIKESS